VVQDSTRAQIWCGGPGIIQSFDRAKMTATVQPAIMAKVLNPAGVWTDTALPLLVDCPVQFPSGGGCILTFDVAKDDECWINIADRCIDAWWQSGGVQPQAEMRMHDLSDGCVFVGQRSQPNVLPSGVTAGAAVLQSNDGSTFLALNPTAQTVDITAPGGSTITADVSIVGTLHVTGQITSDTDVVAGSDSISLVNHVHTDVQVGLSDTGPATG